MPSCLQSWGKNQRSQKVMNAMITKSWSRMYSDIMVIRIMRNLDLDHRPRRGIGSVSFLDKHATGSELPIYLPLIPIFFHTTFWSFSHSLPNIMSENHKRRDWEIGKGVELVERKGSVWHCDGFEGCVIKEKRVQDRDLSMQAPQLAVGRYNSKVGRERKTTDRTCTRATRWAKFMGFIKDLT